MCQLFTKMTILHAAKSSFLLVNVLIFIVIVGHLFQSALILMMKLFSMEFIMLYCKVANLWRYKPNVAPSRQNRANGGREYTPTGPWAPT